MEQRKHPRIGPLVVRAVFRLGERSSEGYLLSISEGGAFLATDEPIPEGKKLQLQSRLPWGLGDIEAEAEVVYSVAQSMSRREGYPPGVGLAFVDLSPADQESIRSYVSKFRQIASQIEQEVQRG